MTKQCYVSRGAGGVGCDCETHPWLTFQSPQIGIHAYCPIKVTVGHSILNWSDLNSVFPTWIFLRKLVQRSSLRKVTGLLHHTVLFHQSLFIRHRFWQSFLVKLFSLNPPLVPRIAAPPPIPPPPCHQQRLRAAVDTLRVIQSRVLFWLGLPTPSVSTLVRFTSSSSCCFASLFLLPWLCRDFSQRHRYTFCFLHSYTLFLSQFPRAEQQWEPLTSPDRPAWVTIKLE